MQARQKEHIRAQMAADLEQRRAKLAAKLAAEEAQLQRELLDLQVCAGKAVCLISTARLVSWGWAQRAAVTEKLAAAALSPNP